MNIEVLCLLWVLCLAPCLVFGQKSFVGLGVPLPASQPGLHLQLVELSTARWELQLSPALSYASCSPELFVVTAS